MTKASFEESLVEAKRLNGIKDRSRAELIPMKDLKKIIPESKRILQERVPDRIETQLRLKSADETWEESEYYITQALKLKEQSRIDETTSYEEDEKIFYWIRNPVTRTFTYELNSDLEWQKVESVQHLPKISGNKTNPAAPMNVIAIKDTSQRNPDIPVPDAFEDMGLTFKTNHKYPMDKVHFQECCVSKGQNLLAFFEKNVHDYQKPFYMRESWLMEQLPRCTFKEANKFSETIERLSLPKQDILKLIHGYYNTQTNRFRTGLKDRRSWRKTVGKYNNIARQMQELKKNEVHSGETNVEPEEAREVQTTGCSEYSLQQSLPESFLKKIGTIMLAQNEDEIPDDRTDLDKFDKTGDSVFGLHRLYHEDEAVSHELLTYIRTATRAQINLVQGCFFPQKNPETGYMKKAKFRHLTQSQRSQVWRYIKDRDAELSGVDDLTLKF